MGEWYRLIGEWLAAGDVVLGGDMVEGLEAVGGGEDLVEERDMQQVLVLS